MVLCLEVWTHAMKRLLASRCFPSGDRRRPFQRELITARLGTPPIGLTGLFTYIWICVSGCSSVCASSVKLSQPHLIISRTSFQTIHCSSRGTQAFSYHRLIWAS